MDSSKASATKMEAHSVTTEIATAATGASKQSPSVLAEHRPKDKERRLSPNKKLSQQVILAAGRATIDRKRGTATKNPEVGFPSSFAAVMPVSSDAFNGAPTFPREAIPALRLHFQSSRAEYVERRLNACNEGVIELYCKLCLRLIVASRDEFVFPIAVKAHKCGRGRDTRIGAGERGWNGPHF